MKVGVLTFKSCCSARSILLARTQVQDRNIFYIHTYIVNQLSSLKYPVGIPIKLLFTHPHALEWLAEAGARLHPLLELRI